LADAFRSLACTVLTVGARGDQQRREVVPQVVIPEAVRDPPVERGRRSRVRRQRHLPCPLPSGLVVTEEAGGPVQRLHPRLGAALGAAADHQMPPARPGHRGRAVTVDPLGAHQIRTPRMPPLAARRVRPPRRQRRPHIPHQPIRTRVRLGVSVRALRCPGQPAIRLASDELVGEEGEHHTPGDDRAKSRENRTADLYVGVPPGAQRGWRPDQGILSLPPRVTAGHISPTPPFSGQVRVLPGCSGVVVMLAGFSRACDGSYNEYSNRYDEHLE
jgi:hypothetical protein